MHWAWGNTKEHAGPRNGQQSESLTRSFTVQQLHTHYWILREAPTERASENTDYETDLLKVQSGCVMDANFTSKVKEPTGRGKVIIFCVCLLLGWSLEVGKVERVVVLKT